MARDEFEALPKHGQAALAHAIARWQRGQSLPAEVKPLAGGLLELRVQVGRDPYRAIFFKDTPVHDVCVLAVYKNQRRLPKSDLYLARQRMRQGKTEGS
ncbi:MAG: type II toxin-antitoxin system RelE/ParE family toxin [Geodermatophilaceae bacterium]|nr:type II toxin-antitoxin system RelE/ParE family toxin [Geodermatophilaceae bacterium]